MTWKSGHQWFYTSYDVIQITAAATYYIIIITAAVSVLCRLFYLKILLCNWELHGPQVFPKGMTSIILINIILPSYFRSIAPLLWVSYLAIIFGQLFILIRYILLIQKILSRGVLKGHTNLYLIIDFISSTLKSCN